MKYLAVLITGGYTNEGWLRSAEIYLPAANTGCSLPDLPAPLSGQTQEGNLACGGSGINYNECIKWENGSWNKSHSLRGIRFGHASWATASGVHIIGGRALATTSELVKDDGSVEESFKLKYQTE